MSNFNRGDKVIATLPNGSASLVMFVTDTVGDATNCLYLSNGYPVSVTVPTNWLAIEKTKVRKPALRAG